MFRFQYKFFFEIDGLRFSWGALRAGIIILQHDDEKRLCIKRNVYENHFLGYFQIKLRNNNGLLSLYVRNAYIGGNSRASERGLQYLIREFR